MRNRRLFFSFSVLLLLLFVKICCVIGILPFRGTECDLLLFLSLFLVSVLIAVIYHRKISAAAAANNDYIKQNELLQNVFKAGGDGFFEIELESGRTYYSDEWKRMLGYEPWELGETLSVWENMTTSETRKRAKAGERLLISGKIRQFQFEYKMKHKKGYWIDILSKSIAVFDADRAVRIVGTHTNITETKAAEQKMLEQQQQLTEMLEKTEKQRLANLIILNDYNDTTKELKREIREHEEVELKLQSSHERLRELSHHLQNAREQQSAYIAREIHDDFGQALTSVEMTLTYFEQLLDKKDIADEDISEILSDLRQGIELVVEKSRRLTLSLRPLILETSDIVEAVQWLVMQSFENSEQKVVFESSVESVILPEETELAVYRIVQEALNNINKHSGADNIEVKISMGKNVLNITIDDDGIGFDPASAGRADSFGLLNMKERALFCEGELLIGSTPGIGTKLKISIPVEIRE